MRAPVMFRWRGATETVGAPAATLRQMTRGGSRDPSHGRTCIPADAHSEALLLHHPAASLCGSDTDRMSGGGQHRRKRSGSLCLSLSRSTVFSLHAQSSVFTLPRRSASQTCPLTQGSAQRQSLGRAPLWVSAQNRAQSRSSAAEVLICGAALGSGPLVDGAEDKKRMSRSESVKAALT